MMSGVENGILMLISILREGMMSNDKCRRILDLIFETVKDMFKLIYLK